MRDSRGAVLRLLANVAVLWGGSDLPTFGARLLLTSLQPAYLSTQIALAGGGVPDWTEESIPRVGLGFSVVIPRTWGLHHLPGPLIRARIRILHDSSALLFAAVDHLRRRTQLPSALSCGLSGWVSCQLWPSCSLSEPRIPSSGISCLSSMRLVSRSEDCPGHIRRAFSPRGHGVEHTAEPTSTAATAKREAQLGSWIPGASWAADWIQPMMPLMSPSPAGTAGDR